MSRRHCSRAGKNCFRRKGTVQITYITQFTTQHITHTDLAKEVHHQSCLDFLTYSTAQPLLPGFISIAATQKRADEDPQDALRTRG